MIFSSIQALLVLFSDAGAVSLLAAGRGAGEPGGSAADGRSGAADGGAAGEDGADGGSAARGTAAV